MKIVSLSEVSEIVNGGTPKTEVPEYWDGNILWITPKDLGKITTKKTSTTQRMITSEGLANSSAKLIPKDSVIMSTRAPIGHIVINDKPMSFNQGCKGLIPKSNIDVNYLYYFLKFSKQKLNDLGTGTTFPELSNKALSSVTLPLYSIDEQRQIVAKLDAAFEKINQAIELGKRGQLYVRAFYKSKLESIFLDQNESKEFLIQDVCTIKGGKRLPKGSNLIKTKTAWPYIRVSDFDHKGGVDQNKIQYLDESTQKLIERYIITDGDVFLSIAGSIGITGIVPAELNGANLTENACRLIPNQKIDKEYLYYFTLTKSFLEQAAGATRQTAQPKLALIRIKNIRLQLPDLNTQAVSVTKLKKLSTSVESLELHMVKKIDYLRDLKQSMLNDAFSENAVK